MAKRTGLGRGIGALIPTSEASLGGAPVDVFFPARRHPRVTTPSKSLIEVPGARLAHIDPHAIVPNPRQPRTHFDADDLAELVHSVREFGVLQPVVVRDVGDGTYELIMGERRTRAARDAGLDLDPRSHPRHRRRASAPRRPAREPPPLRAEPARGGLRLPAAARRTSASRRRSSPSRIGRSRPQISNTIRLLKLPLPVQQRVAAGVLTAGHARAILSLDDPDAMQRLADKIVNEDLSVRAAEAAAKAPDAGRQRASRPQAGARRAHLDELAERLGDRLNTRVKISLGARKGQISIDFASIQDLNRILDELGEIGLRLGLSDGGTESAGPSPQHGGLGVVAGKSGCREEFRGCGIRSTGLLQQFGPDRVQRPEFGELGGDRVDLDERPPGPSAIETATARLSRTTGDGRACRVRRRAATMRGQSVSAAVGATAWHSATAAWRP